MRKRHHTIRPARSQDAEKLATIWVVMSDQHRGYDPGVWCWSPDARQHWMKDFLGWVDNEDMVVLAAEDADGELAGYAVAVCEQSPPLFSTGRTGKVWDLCVLQDHRGCGLGVELMEAVFNELQKRGAEDVTLHVALANPAAIRLYEKLGMRAVMYRMHKKL